MPFEPGTKLGNYEILAPIAANGIEVYKAADAERTVVIQVIPPEWTAASEFPAKKDVYQQANRAVAALQHPNIRALLDIGQQDGVDFCVLEYLEGQTLAERLKGKALALDEAVAVAAAIADALDKAHSAGVVHRGLNPSNILLTKAGPKLLDFGWSELRPSLEAFAPPRKVTAVQPGKKAEEEIDLHYATPEQLEGRPADARTDIFALGAIFYEMLTGKKAFEARSRPALIAIIATADPEPLAQAAPRVPKVLDHIIQRCLEKSPDDRWQTVTDLLIQLRWMTGGAPGAAKESRTVARVALAGAALLIAALAYPAARYFRAPVETAALQFRIPVAGLSTSDIAMSPDSQAVAMVVRPETQKPSALYVRRMGSIGFLKLGSTDDAVQPFWSPDSRYVGFVTGGRLKSVNIEGGAPKDICEAPSFFGGSWNREGTILFGSATGLMRVSAEGGKPAAVTTVAAPETGHYWPGFLPDGRHFLYTAWSAQPAGRAVFSGSLDSKDHSKLLAAESNVAYAAPGYVVFHREASLFAQPFDAARRALTGEPVHVTGEVASTASNGRGHFDVSQTGGLVYFQGRDAPAGRARPISSQYGWVDRNGSRGQTIGEGGMWGDIDLSPDGKLIAVTQQDAGGADIWIIDWQRDAQATRLTLDPADDVGPIWSPDGARVAFTTYRKGNADIYVKNANTVGDETPILATSSDEIVKDWSKDGRYLAFLSGADNFMDIYALPLGAKPGEEKPFPVVQGKFRKNEPQFSYDVKWLAYTSDATGKFEVTVQSFPAGDQKLQVSTAGGGEPRWRKDGKELYFRAPDGAVMAVEIKTSPKLEAGVPRLLLRAGSGNSTGYEPVRHQLGVTPDGQRFLLRFGAIGQFTPRGEGRGGRGGIPEAVPFPNLSTSGPARALTGVNAAGAPITTGLTVIQHWPALLGKGEK